MDYPFVPVGGTPLLPPAYLTVYLMVFFAVLCVLYIYFYRKKRPGQLWQKIKLLLILGLVLKATAVLSIGVLAVYWLVPSPSVRRTNPAIQADSFSPTDKIEIVFDRPVNRSLLEKTISPETPGVWVFENSIYTTHLYRKLVFYPTYSLRPDTTYTVKLAGVQNLAKLSKPYDFQFDFTTQNSPKVVAVSPVSGQREIPVNSSIQVTLSSPNAAISEFEFVFTPKVDYEATLNADKTGYTVTPKTPLAEGTEYNLKIFRSDVILNMEDKTVVERSTASQEYDGTFTTQESSDSLAKTISKNLTPKQPAKITSITPQNGWSAVAVNSPIKITFSEDVDHTAAESKFSISPDVDGTFNWEGKTLVFTPSAPLAFTTSYTIDYADTKVVFTTQNTATKLGVPAYLQKYTLSCEIAALRMALNFRGANVTEDDLIPKVGLDPAAHVGDTWGNPNVAFVGNIRGTQMKDGYGVHWAPIARVAREYRGAQDFQGWSVEKLTEAIANNNPVIIWVYSHFGTPTSWKTPDGTNIYAVRDEHAVVAVGFVGPASNPTQIIINDPLYGQVYWSRSLFDKKWAIFSNSGVVVY